MTDTLPLFQDLPDPEPVPAGGPVPTRGQTPNDPPVNDDRHLRAAWRLSRTMWRYPEGSLQQTRAGLAICHHLQALLQKAESADHR